MCKPLQLEPPQTRNAKSPPLNRPPPPRGGLVLRNCRHTQSKIKQKVKAPPKISASKRAFEK